MRNSPAFTRLAILASLLALTACRETEKPEDAMVGVIVNRNIPASPRDGNPTLHIRKDGDACGVVYTIDSNTKLRRATATGSRSATLDEFTIGSPARAWAPFIAESCPGQATATTVELQ